MTRRRYVLLGAISLLAVLWGSGCTPPPAEKIQLEGVEAFNAWAAANVHEVDVLLEDRDGCGGYDAITRTVFYNRTSMCVSRFSKWDGGMDWWRFHEVGHALDVALGFPYGADHERAAQCIAAAVFDGPGPVIAGYPRCAPVEWQAIRLQLREIGAW
jgi:hypothetical protein